MLLFWESLLCWGLLPLAQGGGQHMVFLRVSRDQLESDLLLKYHVLDHVTRIPVTGATSEGVAILDHLPFVREGLSKKSSGLDLSLVRDLLSGQNLPLLGELLQAGGLVIEEAKGPEVTLQILSDSLLQVTLRCKLYLSFQRILELKVIKNIHIGVWLEQTGNKTSVAFEECHTPPGYLSIEVLEQIDPLLVNKALAMVTDVLDEALPFLLQKTVCPLATTLLNLLLKDLLHSTLSPASSGLEDFQYYVITTEFTEEAILMKVRGSMADLAFPLGTYNDILSCLYTSKEIHVNSQDPVAADLIQLLSLRELEPGPKKLLSRVVFFSKNQELKLQFSPNSSITVTLGLYPPALQSRALSSRALPSPDLLREQGLLLPNIKGISFDQARMEPSE
ncbi:hypothetical protein Cadr_000021255, partial [Camelus dromedarius]